MSKTDKEKLFRVAFLNHGKVYELYCTGICTSGLLGFVEVSGLVFDETDSMVIDPTEEKMRDEFEGVELLAPANAQRVTGRTGQEKRPGDHPRPRKRRKGHPVSDPAG